MATEIKQADSISVHEKHYINGMWVESEGTERLDVINPATEEVIGRICSGTPADVDKAVAAARSAFESWSQTSLDERAGYLLAIADELEARQEEIAELIAREVGAPISFCRMAQVTDPPAIFRETAEIMKNFRYEKDEAKWLNIREPIGVVGSITPWNYPMHLMCGKSAPAIASGCTIVLKPTEVKPLTSFVLAEIIDNAGLPAGVWNMVNGTGASVGEAIVQHPDIDMVHFTGSLRAGRRISEVAARTVKRVALEMGGKSACVILGDADLEAAVKDGLQDCYANTGQTCCAHTRMLVPRDRHDEAVNIARAAVESLQTGDPTEDTTNIGPLISATQRDQVRSYIEKGIDEGATLVTGGAEPPDGLARGYYVRPTVFSNVSNEMTIAQEEIFGPVLCIIPYDSEEDAVRIANDSIYGLGGGVWAGSQEHAEAVARRLRTGQVRINGAPGNLMAPFGGFKQSGNGREYGKHGYSEYFEIKSLQR